MTWKRLMAMAGGAVGALCGQAVDAQESLLPLPLENTSVTVALEKAKREHRVLVVVREWKRPPQGRRPWWANDSVRAWLKWHAVLVELKTSDAEGMQYMRGVPLDQSNVFWGLDVFVDGVHVRLLRCDQIFIPNPLCPACNPAAARGPDDWADSGAPCVSPTATAVLQQLDFQRWCAAERAPIWAQLHELDCPEPKRPARKYLSTAEKSRVQSLDEPPVPLKGERYVDLLSRLQHADTLAASDQWRERLATLTWLWERGGELDPAFTLARSGLVLPRLVDMMKADPAVREQMTQVADAEFALYPWFDDQEEVDYLCLRLASGVNGGHGGGGGDQVLRRLAVENVDLDEETMGAIVGARVGDLKARITQLPLDRPMSPAEWKSLVRAAGAALPRTIDSEPRARWERASVELLAIASIRTYSLLLASADPASRERATQIAADVLRKSGKAPPALRAAVLRSLVFAAASAGKCDSTHSAWLSEAAKLDPAPVGEGSTDPLARALLTGR